MQHDKPPFDCFTEDEREMLTSTPAAQNVAHQNGAYQYLDEIDLTPRYGVISSFVKFLRCSSVLDLGCGQGRLRCHLPDDIKYLGIDESEFAIEKARGGYIRQNTEFLQADFHEIQLPSRKWDCVIWAGIGYGFLKQAGEIAGWRDTISAMSDLAVPSGYIILEMIQEYRGEILKYSSDLDLISECHLNCASSKVHPLRSVYLFSNRG